MYACGHVAQDMGTTWVPLGGTALTTQATLSSVWVAYDSSISM
jgi:hypothetical protein